MTKALSMDIASKIMGRNFIGPDSLKEIERLDLKIPRNIPTIQFSVDELEQKKNNYILILGISSFKNGKPVSIRNLINIFGKDPDVNEPCFYNQDWYDREDFIDIQLEDRWYLIKKNVYEESRAVQPNELSKNFVFPSAICCVYAFFIGWYVLNIKLWYLDFVWCVDTDHNGDRIYVGKYYDIDGINKNGFSIHRHLSLRQCYACIDVL